MKIAKRLKQSMIDQLTKTFSDSRNMIVIDVRGLTVHQAVALRSALALDGSKMKVVKNTLAGIALKKCGIESLAQGLTGMTAVVYGQDPISIAKKVAEYAQKTGKLQVRGGLIEKKPATSAEIAAISQLPSKQQILARFAGVFNSPVASFTNTIRQINVKFVCTLKAVGDKTK